MDQSIKRRVAESTAMTAEQKQRYREQFERSQNPATGEVWRPTITEAERFERQRMIDSGRIPF